ncbi:MAG: hypothetical protein R2911_34730 [Caldilineaceae bacterium]
MTRIAFIGAGARSVGHMATLTHLPNVEVVALADLGRGSRPLPRPAPTSAAPPTLPPLRQPSSQTTGACWMKSLPTASISACRLSSTARSTTT